MLKQLISAVKECYSGPAAKQHVAAISQYHRVQASPGYRAAAEYCLGQLRSWGVEAEMLTFPADSGTTYWTCTMFQEWEASEATLDLLLPDGARRLADYREDRISVVQRSLPFDGEAEVVPLGMGTSEGEYQGLDVAGKVVLATGDIREVCRLAVQERGAAGILADGIRPVPHGRERIDLPDARQYTSFWWRPGEEPKGFGFVLTPRQGDELRTMAGEKRAKGQGPLRVRARVVSRLYDGHIEVVSALIPGETAEEALVVAHLCHPQASANDNGSGAGAILELARALRTLIDQGRLPRPRRSIRLLWVPEMTGTFAYLATHEEGIPRTIAGINLDMVGQNQALCGSSFLIERPPEAMASFAGDLAEALRDALADGAPNLGGTGTYPLYRQAVTAYSGGSDHYILSDPTVGIPTPMLIQWPDRFYHTSQDTIDKVDEGMLAVIGGLATAYAYFVAASGGEEARWLAREMVARARHALARLGQDGYTAALEAGSPEEMARIAQRAARCLAFRADRAVAALRTLSRLAPGLDQAIEAACLAVQEAGTQEEERLLADLGHLAGRLGAKGLPAAPAPAPDEWTTRAEGLVLRRLFRGPIGQGDLMARLGPAEQAQVRALTKEHPEAMHGLPDMLLYWMDGWRSLREIADLVECEIGKRNLALAVQSAELLERAGLLERVPA